ncbi:hypothetical protein [Amycolatopsis alba]|uniref:hypothetical protein n=1 Tax=Amycolatopsis alba TaxID=76020 RepID=UPI001B80A198|nr:hypothetical protein [Amycolatopsis alba]
MSFHFLIIFTSGFHCSTPLRSQRATYPASALTARSATMVPQAFFAAVKVDQRQVVGIALLCPVSGSPFRIEDSVGEGLGHDARPLSGGRETLRVVSRRTGFVLRVVDEPRRQGHAAANSCLSVTCFRLRRFAIGVGCVGDSVDGLGDREGRVHLGDRVEVLVDCLDGSLLVTLGFVPKVIHIHHSPVKRLFADISLVGVVANLEVGFSRESGETVSRMDVRRIGARCFGSASSPCCAGAGSGRVTGLLTEAWGSAKREWLFSRRRQRRALVLWPCAKPRGWFGRIERGCARDTIRR